MIKVLPFIFTLTLLKCIPNFQNNKDTNNFAFLFSLALGGATTNNFSFEPGSTIDLSGDGAVDATFVDINNDGVSDGINLGNSGIANMILIDSNQDGIPDSVDVNGDGSPDYFLNPNGPPYFTTENGGGRPVLLIIGSDGAILGFDTNGDGIVDDISIANTLNDHTPPIVSISPSTGTFPNGQNIIISCSDNIGIGSLIYKINGTTSDPRFPNDGNIIIQPSYTITLNSDGVYYIRALCRDLAGNVSTNVANQTFTIDSNVPVVTINHQSSPYISGSPGAISSSTIDWTVDRNGSFLIRESNGSCNLGTILSGPSPVTSGTNLQFERSALSHFSGEVTKKFTICVTSNSGLTGFATFTIQRDDTAPIVSILPNEGNFTSPTSLSLSCADTNGSGCDKIAYTSSTTGQAYNPSISSLTGLITNGNVYSSSITLSDPSQTNIKFLARDHAGNVSSITSKNYTVDSITPVISILQQSATTITNSANLTIEWKSNRAGTYEIRIGGDSCTNGTLVTGTNVSGSTSSNDAIFSTINNSSLALGTNSIRICVTNLVGSIGSILTNVTLSTSTIVAGWNFGVQSNTTLLATHGASINLNQNKLCQTTTGGTIAYPTGFGETGVAYSSTNWSQGASFYCNFSTIGFSQLTVSSAQLSSGTGPRNFRLEYSLDGINWIALIDILIQLQSSWVTLDNWILPAELNNQTNVYLRWVVTSTASPNGSGLAFTGTSRIDEIYIKGFSQ
ncbi:hypothetical protein EHQ46_06440 [Leptospira yanagawae]|uniref:Chitobiase/beta-hexosaminidase n=1 Tax=Leptospira yanagawae TaxID=293069 RepID=A0ABY2M4C9_9LEPT|nr:chitobiase/beta-hexosaminidase C-terminal domain-containing protein [Leptospira yanagawae]TGL22350.1 hypothetical protein EHQ46_06440 [Leptospira yanagawae]